MLKEPEGLLDGVSWDDLPPAEPIDRSTDADFMAFIEQAAKDAALREREAQTEAEAISLSEDIEALILPSLREEHCVLGVTTPSGRVSKLTDQDWAAYNDLKSYTAKLGTNINRQRWQISEEGCAAFLIHEAAEHGADHARKYRNGISRVVRALTDVTEQPVVRAAMWHMCESGPDDNKPSDEKKDN
jgi:hypothetical protein